MWRHQGTLINVNSAETYQRQIISNLNPNAKEFYPNYIKSWRSVPEPQRVCPEMVKETCTVMFWPPKEKISIYEITKSLVDIKFQIESKIEWQYGTQIITESKKHARIVKPNNAVASTKLPMNKANGAIKKIPVKAETKSSLIASNTRMGNSSTRPILKTISSTTPLHARSTTSGCSTPKDAASIKSNSSSDKSYSVRFSPNVNKAKAHLATNKSLIPPKSAKSKESLPPKTPRGTVASNLRKSEIHKVS
ncbi:uncharacterized protein [Musca autumnalis]|uniref:uncharacterized protein n=1 Tax=Musca autumnalis TaxID=221902 RepID=UPI003CEEBC92